MRRTHPLLVLLTIVVIVLAAVPVTALGQGGRRERALDLTVVHGAVTATLADKDSNGHQVGDVRVFSFPVQVEGPRRITGRVDATLTTTAIDVPSPGDEIRIGLLVFSFGPDGTHQVVVQGSSVYPGAASTIPLDTSTVRPVVGGSGRFMGATGWAESFHLSDGTWRHELRLLVPRGLRLRERAAPRNPGASTVPSASSMPSASTVPSASIVPGAAVTRVELGSTLAETAPGQRLGLWRVVIPAGASLPAHWHPGYQLARVESGNLTYTILTGELLILRGDGTTETAHAGDTVMIAAGDSVVEQPGSQHAAQNIGSEEIRIVLATLLEDGAAAAIPVGSASPPEAAPSPDAPAEIATPAASPATPTANPAASVAP